VTRSSPHRVSDIASLTSFITQIGSSTSAGRNRRASYTAAVRVLGIDYGARRIGLALSDATGTLASPWRRLERPPSERETLRLVAELVDALRNEDDGLGAIVVGWPRRLDGSPTHQTPLVEAFRSALSERTGLDVVLQDERLSSHAAEERLTARGVRDWRDRKKKLDAAAAAVILQDYLDTRVPAR
jgi:putative Holliday junction resolvase